jgi:hypothetical protein
MNINLDKLKKIPLFKNVDFEDPRAKKRLALVFGAAALMLMVLIANIARSDKDVQPAVVTNDVFLELPDGKDNDILEEEDMVLARQRMTPGNKALFEEAKVLNPDDPLAFLNPEDMEEGPGGLFRRGRTTQTESMSVEDERDARKAAARAMFGLTDDDAGGKKDAPPTGTVVDAVDAIVNSPNDIRNAIADGASSKVTPATAGAGTKKSREEIEAQEDQENRIANKPSKKTTPASGRSRTLADAERQKRDGTTTAQASQDEPQEETRRGVRRSGGISSLDGDWGTIEGISSLDSESQYVTEDDDHPYKVMFTRDQKIKSGDRITIRLMEDMAVDNVLIPKNTHLTATCQIGERLQIIVSNIEIGGHIYALNYIAYDNDGSQGLYCPISGATQAKDKGTSTATQAATQLLSSAASIAGAAMGSGALGGMLGNMTNIGASAIASRNGSVTAQVNSGYTFYLLKN